MVSITVGFIGTGAMGEHMCRNIAKNGDHPVIAFDLSPAPLNRLSNHGVTTVSYTHLPLPPKA